MSNKKDDESSPHNSSSDVPEICSECGSVHYEPREDGRFWCGDESDETRDVRSELWAMVDAMTNGFADVFFTLRFADCESDLFKRTGMLREVASVLGHMSFTADEALDAFETRLANEARRVEPMGSRDDGESCDGEHDAGDDAGDVDDGPALTGAGSGMLN